MLDKLHKSVCVTVATRATASLEHLGHCVNVASLTSLRYFLHIFMYTDWVGSFPLFS